MTIRFISNFSLSVFHWYKRKSCRNTNIEGYFHFSSSDKIMSCKLWSKVASVFRNINFCAKMSILGKKLNFVRNVDFFQTIVHYYWKWTSYWKTCLFSENCDFLCDCLYTWRNCRILIKTLIFLRKCLFVHVLIFIKVVYLWKIVILIQNIISFGDILDKSVISW